MENQAFAARVVEGLDEEKDNAPLTWWLSFADGSLPKVNQFLGVILVDNCPGLVHARMAMTLNGVKSPGGQICGFGFDPSAGPPDQVAALAKLPRLTLLSHEALKAAGMELVNP